MTKVQEYVVGFALDGDRVALIEKNRPAWQAGRLNGIGGHVEPGEHPLDAMRREFREETGAEVEGWSLLVTMDFPGARIHFYRALVTHRVLSSLHTTTDEAVRVYPLHMVRDDAWWPIIPNLSWLLPLAAYTADTYEPIHVRAAMAETLSSAPVTDQGEDGGLTERCPVCGGADVEVLNWSSFDALRDCLACHARWDYRRVLADRAARRDEGEAAVAAVERVRALLADPDAGCLSSHEGPACVCEHEEIRRALDGGPS